MSRRPERPPNLMAPPINSLKQFRRTPTRYDQQAETRLAMPHVGSI